MLSTTAIANKARFAAPSVGKPSRARNNVCVVRASAEQPKEAKVAPKVAGMVAAAALILGAPGAHALDFPFSKAKQQVESARDSASQGLKDATSGVGDNLSSGIGGMNDRLADKARSNTGVLNQDTRSAQPASGNSFEGQGGTSSLGAGSINPSEAAGALGDAKDSVVGKLKSAGGAVGGAKSAANEAANKASDAKDSLLGKVQSAGGAASSVKGAANEAANKASDAKDSLVNKVGNPFGSSGSDVKGAANEAANKASDAKDSLVGKVQNASGTVGDVKGAANEAANKASGLKESLVGKAQGAGAAVKSALNVDVGDKAGQAADAIKGAANSATSGSSPSAAVEKGKGVLSNIRENAYDPRNDGKENSPSIPSITYQSEKVGQRTN
jgi:hypothetical protein